MATTQEHIRNQITKQIIEALEKGGLPPRRQPWIGIANTGRPANVVSSKPYRGINPLLLASIPSCCPFISTGTVFGLGGTAPLISGGTWGAGSCGAPQLLIRSWPLIHFFSDKWLIEVAHNTHAKIIRPYSPKH